MIEISTATLLFCSFWFGGKAQNIVYHFISMSKGQDLMYLPGYQPISYSATLRKCSNPPDTLTATIHPTQFIPISFFARRNEGVSRHPGHDHNRPVDPAKIFHVPVPALPPRGTFIHYDPIRPPTSTWLLKLLYANHLTVVKMCEI